MDIEIVKWNKEIKELIEERTFKNITEATKYYRDWECKEKNNDIYYVSGNNWNVASPEDKIPENHKYIYTYSVILWKKNNQQPEHYHNFIVYKMLTI